MTPGREELPQGEWGTPLGMAPLEGGDPWDERAPGMEGTPRKGTPPQGEKGTPRKKERPPRMKGPPPPRCRW